LDHYNTLRVTRGAEPEVIDRAYRALCLKYHPDVVADTDRSRATREMQRINAAYSVLSDPDARRRYDRTLPAATDPSAWDTFMSKGLLGMFLDKMMPPE
jgi:DnaJ-class molecular chaperone